MPFQAMKISFISVIIQITLMSHSYMSSSSYTEASSIYVLEPTRRHTGSNSSQTGSAQLQQVHLQQQSLSHGERRSNDEEHDRVCNGIAMEGINRRLSAESHSYEQMTGGYDFSGQTNSTTSQTNGHPCSSAVVSSLNMGKHFTGSEPQFSSSLPAEIFHTTLTQCHSSPPAVAPADERFMATLYALERRDSSVPVGCNQKEKVVEKLDDEEDYFADALVLKEIRSSIRRTKQ